MCDKSTPTPKLAEKWQKHIMLCSVDETTFSHSKSDHNYFYLFYWLKTSFLNFSRIFESHPGGPTDLKYVYPPLFCRSNT